MLAILAALAVSQASGNSYVWWMRMGQYSHWSAPPVFRSRDQTVSFTAAKGHTSTWPVSGCFRR